MFAKFVSGLIDLQVSFMSAEEAVCLIMRARNRVLIYSGFPLEGILVVATFSLDYPPEV